MRTFTRLFCVVIALTITVALHAQKSIHTYTGSKAMDKMELIRQLYGSDVTVPLTPEGTSKALGDDCSNPIIISSLPFSDLNQTTTGRGNTYSNTCLNDFDGGEDIIYRIDLLTTTTLQIVIDPKGTPRTGVAISDGCPLSSLCLGMSYDLYNGGSQPHGFTVTLDPGTYFIMVDTWPAPTSIPNFDLTVTSVSPVPNDFCTTATNIGEVLNLPFSTELATDDPSGATIGPEIWFNYTASFTGWAAIDLCGSNYDTYVVVWDGAACPPTILIDDNDDFCGYNGLQSFVVIPVVSGNTYKIEIGGYDGTTGDGLLSIYEYQVCNISCTGTPEGEPCGSDINGGCNMTTPAFTNVTANSTICGNLWSQFGTRDTDWFRIVLNSPGNIKMKVKAEESVVFGMVGQIVLGLPGCGNMTNFLTVYKILPPCQEDSVWIVNLPKGTYYMFLAPMDYYNHACPGFDYAARFEFEELPSGYISGVVIAGDTSLPLQGVKVTAGDAETTTTTMGTYLLEVPVGTYTVVANGYNVSYETKQVTGVTVTQDNITWVNFVLDKLPAPVLNAAVPGIEQVQLYWTPITTKEGDGKTLMGDIFATNEYIPGSTMNLNFKMTIYSPDFEWGVLCKMTFPSAFTPLSAGNLNGVPGTVAGQIVTWNGLFYTSDYPVEIEFSVQVAVSPSASGPQVVLYYVEGDGYGLGPHYFEGALTVYEKDGAYVPTFNVYRKLGPIGNTNTFIPIAYGVIGTYYLDEIYPGGDEWCYRIKQIMPDGTESPFSNYLCVTPLVRPGSLCSHALTYGPVNNPQMPESLVRPDDVRWFKFTVPYTMDVAVIVDNTNFNANVTLYPSCTGAPITPSNYCGSNPSFDVEKIYANLSAGTYYAKVSGLGGTYGSFTIYITQVQLLTIREGWSGFSTYMNVSGNPNIAAQLDCIKNDMIITVRQTPYGIWWPSQNVNTIGNIYNTYGYKSKMNIQRTAVIYGTETPNKTVTLPLGASYLPVRVTAPTSTTHLMSQIGSSLLIIYDMYNPAALIWPDGGINTLPWLVPDYAYLINMKAASSFTYPLPTKSETPQVTEPQFIASAGVWNEVVNTGNPHFISIHTEALKALEEGDFIGVFNLSNRCVGLAQYQNTGQNLFIAAFGDDELTAEVDGLMAGERMIFKVYRPSNGYIYELDVTYSQAMPNHDGLYQLHGMSMIVEMKVGSTNISDPTLSTISIYPNPTSGLLNISGYHGVLDVVISNTQGQVILRSVIKDQATLDLSTLPKGVYMIRLTGTTGSRTEKLVIK